MYLPPKEILMYFSFKAHRFVKKLRYSENSKCLPDTIFAMKTIVIELDQLKFRI